MAKKTAPKNSKVWSVMGSVAAVGAAAVSRQVLDKGWRAVTGRKPPVNPADPEVAAWEAMTWAASTAAMVALARVFAQRKAASYYTRSVGSPPAQFTKRK